MLLAVKGNKLCSLWLCSYHNLMTGNHVCIKAVHWLTVCHHHIVGDVNDIVYRTQADGCQFVLQPIRTLFHLAPCDANAGIALASLLILYGHLDRQVVIVHYKLAAVWSVQRCLITVLLQPSIEVASHAPVRQRICSVGSDVHLYKPVALQIIVFSCWCTHHSIFRQNNNAVVACAHAYLIFGTYHTV